MAMSVEVLNTASKEELDRYQELQEMAIQCARSGESEVLESMIKAGMPVNLCDEKGNSLLMLATYNQHLDTSRMLLENGADTELRNDRGQTPLGGVAFKGYIALAELLLEYGADVNADNGGGKAPLMFATMFGRFKMRKLLKLRGAKMWTPKS